MLNDLLFEGIAMSEDDRIQAGCTAQRQLLHLNPSDGPVSFHALYWQATTAVTINGGGCHDNKHAHHLAVGGVDR